jgi:hypothetical protein
VQTVNFEKLAVAFETSAARRVSTNIPSIAGRRGAGLVRPLRDLRSKSELAGLNLFLSRYEKQPFFATFALLMQMFFLPKNFSTLWEKQKKKPEKSGGRQIPPPEGEFL